MIKSVREWPEDERPREKLLQKGTESLSDAELLAVLLGQGTREQDVVSFSRSLLLQFGGLRGVLAQQPASFKKVKGYHWTICACVNDVLVHGIPDDYVLQDGDVVGIDCGVYYKGFHTDSAWTKRVSVVSQDKLDEVDTFLEVGKTALTKAIAQVKAGNYIYDISKAIQDTVEKGGYQVVRTLVGHGVGRELHEEPEIPGLVNKERFATPQVASGMTLAVEVIYNMGSGEVVLSDRDGWTIRTKDGRISGLFEATVAVADHGSVVLIPI